MKALWIVLALVGASAFAAPREKVLFDTDIGGDPDDGMALTYLLREPRCELLGITTCCGRPEVAARVASALCRSLGRGDVPIHAGCSLPVHRGEKLTPKDPSVRKGGWFGALGDWPHDEIPDDRSAVGFLRRTIRANPGEVTLYASAGFSNLATLFTLDPEIPSLLKRLVVVGGNFDGTNYEWNAYVDVFATAALLEGGFRTPPKSLVLHGAEVTTPWNIPPDEGRAFLAQSPDFAFVRGHYAEQWFRRPINLFFHDPIAAVAIFHPEIMTYAPSAVRVDVADRAKTQRTEPKGDSTWVWQTATAVDFERFRSVFLSVLSAPAADFRPPSVPVVSCDPYFSLWSPADAPTDADTEIWHGAKQPVRVAVELDGVRYRLMGAKSPAGEDARVTDVPALRCVGCRVRPLTTVYRFTDGKAEVELSFLTPKLADELDVFSRPVTYATVRTTGAKTVRVFAEIGSELATDDDAAPMVTNRTTVAGLSAVSIGRRDQKPLSKSGDRVRCDWGYAWLVNPEAEGADVHFLLAYDDVETLQFLDRTLPAWWRRGGKAFEAMLAEAEADYARLVGRSRDFDDRLEAELLRVGGGKYRDLGALAYRQSFAACKLVAADNGHPLYFSKENTSNGCIGTVDVFYPQLPLLLLASKTLTRATLEPILAYATSGRWPFKYAPHDVGVWPLANGQVYNFGPHAKGKDGKPKSDATRMPVEECGNMLIALCALAEAEGDASFAADYWPTVTDWAEYLEAFGFDPGNQLCTDDFAGHLAHNANLSIKSILAFAAYARLAERLGKGDAAAKFRRMAEDGAAKWQAAAKGGAAGGARLAFDRADSWSQKYNLVWDRVLGFGLFPKEVAERELAAYRRQARPFGVPLDSREEYTKLDWEFWSAALTGRRADLDFVTDLVWRYANETPDRHPLPDWYWANNGRVRGFWGRPVIGGVFMPVLAASAACPAKCVGQDPQSPNGVLCLTFDDRNFADWTAALPLFARYGAHASFFVCGPIDDTALAAMRRLREAGHTVGIHTVGHGNAPTNAAPEEIARWFDDQVEPQLKALRAADFPVRCMAYPNNRHDEAVDRYVRSRAGFTHLRAGARGIRYNFKGDVTPETIVRFDTVDAAYRTVGKPDPSMNGIGIGPVYCTSTENVFRALRRAAERNEAVTFFSHSIKPGNTDWVGMKTEWLEAILAEAKRLGLSVRGFDEL